MKTLKLARSFVIAGLSGLLLSCSGTSHSPVKASSQLETTWVSVGPTPGAKEKFTPQGLTFANGHLLLAESQNDERGYVFRYAVNEAGVESVAGFELPADGVHTSGLTWDGEALWAVDYVSRKLYKIDLAASVKAGKAKVLGTYASGMDGLSAATSTQVNGTPYLVVSDFMNSRKTYFIQVAKLSDSQTLADVADFSYKNKGFSQGLVAHGKYLYEASNKLFTDSIVQMDICTLIETQSLEKSKVAEFKTPSNMVEDLAIGAGRFWTSDESTYEIYFKNFKMGAKREIEASCP